MKNKWIIVLVVVLLVLTLLVGGAVAFLWYQNSHVFVEGTAYPVKAQRLDLREEDISFGHYEALCSQLPDCEILWRVPFQGGKYSNDSASLTVTTLTAQDVELLLTYFPKLAVLDASGCRDYTALELLKAQNPQCSVRYQVSLGGKEFDPGATELVLENGDYEFAAMMANLIHLPRVQTIQLKMPELTLEQIGELRMAYEDISIFCTVEILGQEYDNRVTDLDLRDLTSEQVAQIAEKLPMLPNVTKVELTREDGTSDLTMEDVKLLKAAAPQASFHYVFDFYGVKISTTDEEVKIYGKNIGEEGIDNLRSALDLMENCKRFILEYCRIPDELLAQVREEYRDKVKLVWRVQFGGGSTLTDAEIIRCTYDLVDDNCEKLIYCEDARFIDIGHNQFLDGVPFVAGMPNLEVIIVSGAPIKDLTPFANCKKLRVLEIAFCEYLTDVSPLAACESLEMVNIGNTHVTDLSPLDSLNLTHLMARIYPSGKCRVPLEEQERFKAANPETQAFFTGAQPYGDGWRYTEDNEPLDWYAQIRTLFRYDKDPNIPNNTGWYLPEDFVERPKPVVAEAAPAEETVSAEETMPEG